MCVISQLLLECIRILPKLAFSLGNLEIDKDPNLGFSLGNLEIDKDPNLAFSLAYLGDLTL